MTNAIGCAYIGCVKTIIHVNQHKVRAGEPEVLTVKTYKSNDYASEAEIVVDGNVVARVVYRPENPLSCGAKVWIETEGEVRLKRPVSGQYIGRMSEK